MNATEVAKILGTHPENIRRWIREGKIKATKKGRSFDIPQSEVNILKQSKGYEDLGKAQEHAAYQLIANLEVEILSELSQIHLYSDFLQREMKSNGIRLDDYSEENFERRRKVYEEHELSSLRQIVDIGQNIRRLEKLRDELLEIAKEAEQHNTLEKSHDHWKTLISRHDFEEDEGEEE